MIAREFRLGTPAAPPRRLAGLSQARVYALTTDRGDFVVKLSDADPGVLAASSAVERAARAAGVATPTPIEPTGTAAGYWALVEGWHTRVSRAVAGVAPAVPISTELAGWLGRTVATIAGLNVPLPPAVAPPSGPWRDRLPGALRQLAPTLDDLTEVARLAWAQPPPMVPGHRDITPRNILLSADGPLLLDFDHSGATPAWWELVHQSFLLACADLGAEEPDEQTVRTSVAAYAAAGGPVGEPDVTAFAGLIGGLLSWVHDRAGVGDVLTLRQAATSLPLVACALDRWALLLR